MILEFDNFVIDTESFEIYRDSQLCSAEPLLFDLITFLAAHPHQVFSRDELIEAVWKGRIVSDTTIASSVKNARKLLGDSGQAQTYIQTVRGRGYRFTASVTQTDSTKNDQPEASLTAVHPTTQSTRTTVPSLAVIPWRCLSDDPELQHLVDSLILELGTVLTRIPLLNINVQSPHTRNQHTLTARQLHEELGVDFVVDGYLQPRNDTLQINVQLINARTGFQIWANSFQPEASQIKSPSTWLPAIIGKLEPQIHRSMYELVRSSDGQPNARELFLEANGLLVLHGWNHLSFTQATPLLRQSCVLDPDFALAPALLSLLTGFGSRIGLHENPDSTRAEALQSADQALALDSMDSTVVGLAGCGLADIGFMDRGAMLLQNAIDLNGSNAQAWAALGATHIAKRDFDEAISCLSHGISISPLDSRLSVWGAFHSLALQLAGDLPEACKVAETACQRNDRTYLPRLALAAARLQQKDLAGALSAFSDARRIKPDLSFGQIAVVTGKEIAKKLLALEESAARV